MPGGNQDHGACRVGTRTVGHVGWEPGFVGHAGWEPGPWDMSGGNQGLWGMPGGNQDRGACRVGTRTVGHVGWEPGPWGMSGGNQDRGVCRVGTRVVGHVGWPFDTFLASLSLLLFYLLTQIVCCHQVVPTQVKLIAQKYHKSRGRQEPPVVPGREKVGQTQSWHLSSKHPSTRLEPPTSPAKPGSNQTRQAVWNMFAQGIARLLSFWCATHDSCSVNGP